MQRTVRKWLPTEARLRDWLGGGRVTNWLCARKGVWSLHRRALAGGVAVGLFIGLTPTVGLQTPLILAAALLLQVNFPAAFLALWISNPITTPMLYLGFNRLGEWVFADRLPWGWLAGLAPHAQTFVQQSAFLWLGSLLLALPVGAASYLGFIWLWRYTTVRRWRRRTARRRSPYPGTPA